MGKNRNFTLIELLVNTTCKIYNLSPYAALRKREAARCRCRVTGCVSSLRSSYLSRRGVLLPRPLVPALRKREGFGGEKAATCAASLPVPTNLNISFILRKPSRLCQCSASGNFTLLRIFFLRRATAAPPVDRPVPGTGTLPDAGGAGGGGYAPRIGPRKAIHAY